MQDVIDPDHISTTFDDIAGIDQIKQELQDMIILPLKEPQLFVSHSLFSLPKGVLLYGPPGTGKTMLAKALAKESGVPFINLQLSDSVSVLMDRSTLMNMYFGESQKLIRALFSMCRKLSPCILFIDEVDIFLSARGRGNDEVFLVIVSFIVGQCSNEVGVPAALGRNALREHEQSVRNCRCGRHVRSGRFSFYAEIGRGISIRLSFEDCHAPSWWISL